MVKISVVVPVYNAEDFLNDSINSILNQSFEDFEMICVNDGSTDKSLSILNEFASKDSRIKIINQENGGCGSARNTALENAQGDYVYFFDPDDYVTPDAFEKLYNNAVSNKSDLVIFKIARFRDGFPVDYKKPGFDFDKYFKGKDFNKFTFNYKDAKKYVLNTSFAPWTKLYKKDLLDSYSDFKFDLDVAFDDAPFHVKSMLRAKKISFVPEFFYHYRFNPNSINNTASNGIDIFKIIKIIEDFLTENKYMDEFKREFKLFKITQILNYIISTGSDEYFNLAKQNFKEIEIDKDFNDDLIKKFQLVVLSDNLKEYELKLKEYELTKKRDSLLNKNKKLKKDLENAKKLNKDILSSRSWKILKKFKKG